MYKPKPLTDADIDKFIADLEPDNYWLKAEAEYKRLYKQPEPRLGILWAIAGLCMLVGSVFFLLWWLYPVYQKIVGGIR